MAKKKGLPFVVKPRLKPIIERVGTEESGILEIERRGFLNVAEKAMVQQTSQTDSSITDMYALGSRIASKLRMQHMEVMKDLLRDDRPDYLLPWEEEVLENIIAMVAAQDRLQIVKATTLIICRIDSSWTIERSMDLHPDLVLDLNNFYNDEEAKSVDALEIANKVEGAEGK